MDAEKFSLQQGRDLIARRLHAGKVSGILHLVHRTFDFVLPKKIPG